MRTRRESELIAGQVAELALRKEAQGVVLLAPTSRTSNESGTGTVIDSKENEQLILTCDHVVHSWAQDADSAVEGLSVQVNDQLGHVVRSGSSQGIDLALIRVNGLSSVEAIRFREFPKGGVPVFGFGYAHLAGHDFVRELFCGVVGLPLAIHQKGGRAAVPAWTIHPSEGHHILPGYSGSPLFASSGEIIGILSHQRESLGLAIAAQSVRAFLQDAAEMNGAELSYLIIPPDEGLPQLDPVRDLSDPNRGRFGGQATCDGRRLYADFDRNIPATANSFYIDLVVESTDGTDLVGPAYFYLHDSYPQPKVRVSKVTNKKELRLRDVYCWGVYTVGAFVKSARGDWKKLELNLARYRSIPSRIRSR